MKITSANTVILSSIPLRKSVKRYWMSKFERILSNNGVGYAIDKFKTLKGVLLRYRSDPNRHSNLHKYLKQSGFRTNGYLKFLFETMDTQPSYVLNFVQLFSAYRGSSDLWEVSGETKQRLATIKANPKVPKYLVDWTSFLCEVMRKSSKSSAESFVRQIHEKVLHSLEGHYLNPRYEWLRPLVKNHDSDTFSKYWMNWSWRFRKGWTSPVKEEVKEVYPEVYRDYINYESRTYQADYSDWQVMHTTDERTRALSSYSIDFVDSFLKWEERDYLKSLETLSGPAKARICFGGRPGGGLIVGEIQHIPKKGSGDGLRDIAVPNRFIQMALYPFANRIYNLVRNLAHDATFNQDRFDQILTTRVSNTSLYAGSVDLSKATDNLPRAWGFFIVRSISNWLGMDNQTTRSYRLFREVCRANWYDSGRFTRWTVGQPLGTVPSFGLLALTHNCFVESLAAAMGYIHSPYYILGDDIVITNRKLRDRYVRELSSRAIPLSLHKSYDGELTEFAGKVFIANAVPFHVTDHNPITFNSLLDWQFATGIRIPWNNLPRSITSRIYREIGALVPGSTKKSLRKLASSSYDLMISAEIYGRGTSPYHLSDSDWMSKALELYFEFRETEDIIPEGKESIGLTKVNFDQFTILMDERFSNHNGYYLRYAPVILPDWYKKKFRPCATSVSLLAAASAVIQLSESVSREVSVTQ